MIRDLCGETPSACYEVGDGEGAFFFRVCPKCGRFVKPGIIHVNGEGQIKSEPNAHCSRCGPVEMEFEGYYPMEVEA